MSRSTSISTSTLRTSLALRSTMLLLLATAGVACAVEDPPPDQADSGTAAGPVDSSTGSGVSVTSTTGGLAESSTVTASEPSTATTSSSDTADETVGFFLILPDGGVCIFEGAPDGLQPRCSYCDIAAQDCPDGEKCMPWANDGGTAWNATRCSPIFDDPAGLGEPCEVEGSGVSGIDDCDLGMICFGVDPGTLQGTCTALCNADDEASCGLDEVCVDHDAFAPYVCLPRCDPFDPGSCAADETCRQIGDDLLCVPSLALPEGLGCGGDGQSCAPDQACQPDAELGNCSDTACCSLLCDLSAPDPDLPCSAMPAELCRPFFDEPPPGYEHVGVCGLPPA